MDVNEMLHTRVKSEQCTYYMTGSGGQEWLHRCRRWSATVGNVSSMKALKPKPQCDQSLLLHLWSCYTLTLPALRQLWSWINPQMGWTFCCFVTTLQNMSWHTWPSIKLQRLLPSFCGKDMYWSSEHWPSSWLTEELTLKATSSDSFGSL